MALQPPDILQTQAMWGDPPLNLLPFSVLRAQSHELLPRSCRAGGCGLVLL